jgi:hypothetical protein
MRSFFIFPCHKMFVVRSRILRWAGYVARVCVCVCERRGVHTGLWWGNSRERDHCEDIGIDGRIILKWNFKKYYVVNSVMNFRFA